MRAFKDLKDRTLCPFARSAKIWFGPPWDTSLRFRENCSIQATDLRRFCEAAYEGRYHGFVAGLRVGDAAQNAEDVKVAFRDFLNGLAAEDASCGRCMAQHPLSEDWQFEFGDVRMFLNVFAPCYERPHSKRVESTGAFFVLFQPEFSFDFCGIDPGSRDTKLEIRRRFASAGMPYNGAQIDSRIEALLYMFPSDPFGEPVRWWE